MLVKNGMMPEVVPYGPLEFDPASMVLHYAQETFEGMKAYRTKDGKVQLFRPEMNAKRFANSNKRLSMPTLPVDMFVEAVKTIVKYSEDWIPTGEGESLYIRPFMFATEAAIGVHAASHYKFMIICSPVGAYYAEGVNPVKIYVEDEYVRATKGGTGFTKCGGNYAGSLAAQVKAEELGYSQVLWLDGVHRKYIEEVGSMNVMFEIDNKIVTAPCEGTVLPGVTRDSILHILKDWDYEIEERHLSVDELMEAGHNGKLQEAWGTQLQLQVLMSSRNRTQLTLAIRYLHLTWFRRIAKVNCVLLRELISTWQPYLFPKLLVAYHCDLLPSIHPQINVFLRFHSPNLSRYVK